MKNAQRTNSANPTLVTTHKDLANDTPNKATGRSPSRDLTHLSRDLVLTDGLTERAEHNALGRLVSGITRITNTSLSAATKNQLAYALSQKVGVKEEVIMLGHYPSGHQFRIEGKEGYYTKLLPGTCGENNKGKNNNYISSGGYVGRLDPRTLIIPLKTSVK